MLQMNTNAGKRAACLAFAGFFATAAQSALAQQRQEPSRSQTNEQAPPSEQAQADPDQWTVTDEVAEAWVVVKLATREGLGPIDVEVDNGIATLSGKVESEAAEKRALRIATRTMGVRSVRDQLTVDPTLRDRKIKEVPDLQLAQQVAQSIAKNLEGARAGKDWWFDGWRVEGPYNTWSLIVEADDGEIFLEGELPHVEMMRKAVEAAKQVPGVRTVDSELELEPHYRYHVPYAWRFGSPYYGRAYPYQDRVLPPRAAPEASNRVSQGGQ